MHHDPGRGRGLPAHRPEGRPLLIPGRPAIENPEAPSAPRILARAFTATGERWPLPIFRLLQRFAGGALVFVAAIPPIVGGIVAATKQGGDLSRFADPELASRLVAQILPWLGIGCLTFLITGSLAFVLFCWVRGGIARELAEPGPVVFRRFSAAGRKAFGNVFRLTVAAHCVLMIAFVVVWLAALVLFGGNLFDELAAGNPEATVRFIQIIFAVLAFLVPAAMFFRLAETAAALRLGGVGDALAAAGATLRRSSGAALGVLAPLTFLRIAALGGELALFHAFSAAEGSREGGCALLLARLAIGLFGAIVGCVFDVFVSAACVGLLEAAGEAGRQGEIPPPPAYVPAPPSLPLVERTAIPASESEPGPPAPAEGSPADSPATQPAAPADAIHPESAAEPPLSGLPPPAGSPEAPVEPPPVFPRPDSAAEPAADPDVPPQPSDEDPAR